MSATVTEYTTASFKNDFPEDHKQLCWTYQLFSKFLFVTYMALQSGD